MRRWFSSLFSLGLIGIFGSMLARVLTPLAYPALTRVEHPLYWLSLGMPAAFVVGVLTLGHRQELERDRVGLVVRTALAGAGAILVGFALVMGLPRAGCPGGQKV